MIDGKQSMTPSEVRKMYREQLVKFDKIGIGYKTENGVVVTQVLIDVTKKRLKQLSNKMLMAQ